MKTTTTTAILLTTLAAFVAAHDDNNVFPRDSAPTPTSTPSRPADSKSCPTTLTKTANARLDGCTTTSYKMTSTESVDCGGCSTLVTTTTTPIFFGVGPECVGGQKTAVDDGTVTVTSCGLTSTEYYAAEATTG